MKCEEDVSILEEDMVVKQEEEEMEEEIEEEMVEKIARQPNKNRFTLPFLSKYERAMVIGKRANMISRNSPIYVHFDHSKDDPNPIVIAERELEANVIPFIVRRMLPNGEYEDWKLSELKKPSNS